MQTATEIAEAQKRCMDEVLSVLERRDPEAHTRIDLLFARGARRWSVRGGAVGPQDEMLTIFAEAMASLVRQVDELREELAEAKPRRGRPPKVRKDAS